MGARRAGAFTLVEMVIVIAIVAILAAIAVPRFIDIRSQAHVAARDSIVGSVRAGILTVAAKNQVAGCAGTFPPNLEEDWNEACNLINDNGTQPATFPKACSADPCFEFVIPGGVRETTWSQSAALAYTWDNPTNGAGTDSTCTYSTGNGTLICI